MSDDTTLEEPDKEAIKLVCKLRVTWLHTRIVLFVTNDLFVFLFPARVGLLTQKAIPWKKDKRV